MKQHNLRRRLSALTSLLLICTMLLTSCASSCATSCNPGSNPSTETSKPTEDSKPTEEPKPIDKETDVGNNQTEPHVHTWSEWAVTTEPTCTDAGEERRACTCGESETRNIEAKRHSYTSVVTDPTCTERGYTTHTCECGESYVDTYVSAIDHAFGEWKTTKEATCENKGEQKRECTCGEVETKSISATGHSYSAIVTKPTCTERGYTTFTCDCGDFYTDNYVSATGHSFGVWKTTKEATCESKGEQKRTCACGEFETKSISAKGHTYTSVVTNPTCTEKGYTTHTCDCGDSYVDTYVKAIGHSYKSVVIPPTCTERGYTTHTCHCGDSYVDSYVSTIEHSFGEWETTHKATCEENGEQKRTCVCGEIETKIIPATGHSFGEWITAKEATNEENGEQKRTCACGKIETKVIPAFGHTYTSVVTPPTCTERGYTTHTCECGDSYVDTYVKATGHSYKSVVTPPTCTEQGYTTHTCGCGDFYVDSYIKANGHNETIDGAIEPTCTETGLTEGRKCSVCKKILIAQTVIPANGHTEIAITAKKATCTEDGNIAYWRCTICNKYYSDAEALHEITLTSTIVVATGHKYETAWSYDSEYHWHASACGHSSEIKDYSEHSFVDGKCSTCDAQETSTQQFTVTFVDFDNSIIDIQLVDYGSNATKPSDPTRRNYKFIGWDTTFTNVATDLTVKAQYIRQYTVTFVDYDGTVISTDIVDSGDNATPPSHPIREGYTFTSWNQSYSNIVADMEIMAVYEINRYTVTFVDVDGSVISFTSNVPHGATVTPPKTPDMYFDWSKTKGYHFTGWKNWDASQPIVGNISITAEYSKEITEPIMAIETKEIPKGTTTAEVSVYLCGSFENIYGMSLKLQYAEQLVLSNGSVIINNKLVGSECTLNADNHQYELSWADGKGLNISERLEVLTLTFNIDKYTEVGEYLVKLLEGSYIIDADLSKITPIIIVGHVIITK